MTSKAVQKNRIMVAQTVSPTIFVLCCIVFFMPFFRGLYFEKEFYMASLIISALALIISISDFKNRNKITIETFTEYFAIAFVLFYVITFPFSFNKQLASFEVIKNLTYLITFILITNKLESSSDISIVNWSIVLSGTVVAVIGLGTAFGTFNYNGAFEAGMINSTFQYHNAFGAYMLAVLFLAMGEISSSEKSSWQTYILDALGYLIFVGFILSYSRGAWILLPIAGLAAFIFLRDNALKRVIVHFVAIIIPFIATIAFINKSITDKNSAAGWGALFAGMAITAALAFVFDKIVIQKLTNLKIKKWLVILIVLVFAVIIFTLIMSGAFDNILPESILSRVKGINFNTFTAVERSVFYKDALKIIKEYPLIGTGGGGWNTLYSQYKTYDYTTTQAHNYIIQTWVEVGTLGLALLIGLFLSFVWGSYNVTKNIKDDILHSKVIGVICSGLVLIIHSTIDFDMSLGGYAVLLWIVLAVVAAMEKNYSDKKIVKRLKISNIAFVVIITLVFILSGMFKLGQGYGDKAVLSVKNKEIGKAQEYYEKASKFAPFTPSYKFDLGNIKASIGKQTNNAAMKEEGLRYVKSALELNEMDAKLLPYASSFYFRYGMFDEAINVIENIQKYHPLTDSTYKYAIEVYYKIGAFYLEKGERDKAVEYFGKVVEVSEKVDQINENLNSTRNGLLQGITDAPQSYINERFSISIDEDTKNMINSANDIVSKLK